MKDKDLTDKMNQIGGILQWITNPLIQQLHKLDSFDFRKPATMLYEIKKGFEEAFGKASANIGNRDINNLINVVSDSYIIEKAKQSITQAGKYVKKLAKKDKRYSLLIRLIREVDSRVPFLSIVSFADFDPISHSQRMCEPFDIMNEAIDTKGELRAHAVIRLIRETVEMLYNPYLKRLWILSCLREGKLPTNPPGNLAEQISEHLPDYPGIIDIKANWFRNAASHAQWRYNPPNDTLTMWDKRGNKENIQVKDLLLRTYKMYEISGPTFLHVYELYMIRDLLVNTGIIDVLFDSLKNLNDAQEIEKKKREIIIREKIKSTFDPLEEFIIKQNPDRNKRN